MAKLKKPKIGAIYKHFKGNYYKVIDIVRHSETEEEMVLYLPLYLNKDFPGELWVRPLKMFMEKVGVNEEKVPRFKLIEEK